MSASRPRPPSRRRACWRSSAPGPGPRPRPRACGRRSRPTSPPSTAWPRSWAGWRPLSPARSPALPYNGRTTRMMVLRQSLPFLALLGVLGCGKSRAGDAVLLALGDQVVRRSAFDHHVAELEKRGGAPLGAEVRAALLETFLEERVVVLEARARGLLGPKASADEEQHAVHRLLSEAGATAAAAAAGGG